MAELDKDLNQILNNIGADEITTLDQLSDIQAKNPPSNVYLPYAHNIYDIDLNTRTIYGPSVLSVQKDHKSEIIYFKVDRYFDYMDLANTICIVEYITPKSVDGIPYIYIVPFYDTRRFIKENKMIFPWVVGGPATIEDGILEYAIRFYKIDEFEGNKILAYSLSTMPATSQVLRSIESDDMNMHYDEIIVPQYANLIDQIQKSRTYWKFL